MIVGEVDSPEHALQSDEVSPHKLGFYLNDLLFSAIATKEGHGYGRPKDAFKRLMGDQSTNS